MKPEEVLRFQTPLARDVSADHIGDASEVTAKPGASLNQEIGETGCTHRTKAIQSIPIQNPPVPGGVQAEEMYV